MGACKGPIIPFQYFSKRCRHTTGIPCTIFVTTVMATTTQSQGLAKGLKILNSLGSFFSFTVYLQTNAAIFISNLSCGVPLGKCAITSDHAIFLSSDHRYSSCFLMPAPSICASLKLPSPWPSAHHQYVSKEQYLPCAIFSYRYPRSFAFDISKASNS